MATNQKKLKWTYLRVLRATHDLLEQIAHTLDRPMARIADDAVMQFAGHTRRMPFMSDTMEFFVMYCDNEPLYLVAARDKDVAVEGFRKEMLGKLSFKKLEAVSARKAKLDDLTRVGLLSLVNQVGQINGILQAAMSQAMQRPKLIL